MSRTELSDQQKAFFDRLKSGKWELPPGIRNHGHPPGPVAERGQLWPYAV
jgi:hypothetical protein